MEYRFIRNDAIDNMKIDELELSTRSGYGLQRNRISTVGQLIDYYDEDHNLYKFNGIGKKSVEEIEKKLFTINFMNLKEERKDSWIEEFCKMNEYSENEGKLIIACLTMEG